MPTPKPKPIQLDPTFQQQLESVVARHNTPQQIALRAKIILLANQGCNNRQITEQLHLSRDMVQLWRKRWALFEHLPLSEKSVTERLQDAERPGAPAKISAEAYCQIMTIACKPPETLGRPITHWTDKELSDEVIKQQIVPTISPRQIGRFLKRSRS